MERLTRKRRMPQKSKGILSWFYSLNSKQELVDALAPYEDTGLTPEQIRELKDRNTPMEVTEIHVDEYYCPACGAENNCDQGVVEDNFCPRCGQRLKKGN